MSSRNERYLRTLRQIAETSNERAKLAAAVVVDNEIVGLGVNRMKTHPMQAMFRKNNHAIYIHAEIDAIAKAVKALRTKDLSRATLYIARVKKDRKDNWVDGLAKPCKGCMQAIASFGIKKVIWTED